MQESERFLTMAEAAKLVPPGRNGRPTHLGTIVRWIQHGCKSPTGRVERLRGYRLGGRWLTTQAELRDFMNRLTPDFEAETPPTDATQVSVMAGAKRTRHHDRVAARLDHIGI